MGRCFDPDQLGMRDGQQLRAARLAGQLRVTEGHAGDRDELVGATTRPNELTYSEDWLRPDYIPPAGAAPAPAPVADPATLPPGQGPLMLDAPAGAAEMPVTTDPSHGLAGMMVPGGGS